jgi:prolyl oligopeptidase
MPCVACATPRNRRPEARSPDRARASPGSGAAEAARNRGSLFPAGRLKCGLQGQSRSSRKSGVPIAIICEFPMQVSADQTADVPPDPYLALEDIDGTEARAFIAAENARTEEALCDDAFRADQEAIAAIMAARDKIAFVTKRGGFFYNHWQDEDNPRGLWRRTPLASYRSDTPAWETLLDVDALRAGENENWVWAGAAALPPDHDRAIVMLSRGGADACVAREFDLATKTFVTDGFVLPEAKSNFSWIDTDTLLVASALGEGHATTSGYARTVRRWRRGIPFSDAEVVFAVDEADMAAWGSVDHEPGYERIFLIRRISFFEIESFVLDGAGKRRIDLPADADFEVHRDLMSVQLRAAWTVGTTTYAAGSVLVIDFEAFMNGSRDFQLLFAPSARRVCQGVAWSQSRLALSVLDDLKSQILIATPGPGALSLEPLAGVGANEQVNIWCAGVDAGGATDAYFVSQTGYLTPSSLYWWEPGHDLERLKTAPERFDASGLAVTRHDATAEDGERIPYYQIGRADLACDGDAPTLLYGYGGFEVSLLPTYMATYGKVFVERGGVMVVANIRGGAEFGTAWHRAGTRAGKKRAQDDFAVVARDLIARRVTRSERLACHGGSNGGLLVGNMLTRFPELFGAVWCTVPLLDMARYTKLLAGASWIEEYGDPDKPEDWAFIREFSAYQLVRQDATYPPILITTSARDDRVHPGHARKMAAKLRAYGHDVLFHEPAEGGHGAADYKQAAHEIALGFSFLRRTIGQAGGQGRSPGHESLEPTNSTPLQP